MTSSIPASSVSSPSTTVSGTEAVRNTLSAVPATCGTPVIVLEPVRIRAPLPDGFTDIEEFIEREEVDPAVREAISAGNRILAKEFYSGTPRRLSFFRLRNGWSQKELASRLGTSQSYIARLEAGEIDPQVSTINRLAVALQVSPNEVLEAVMAGAATP
jgi:DNA-binding XRE family transcriptional regulator